MGSYTLGLKKDKKEMHVMVEGHLTPGQAENFIKEYQKHTSSIDATEFALILDVKSMEVVTKEMTPALENCFKLYKSSGFKDVVFQLSEKNSTIIKMQLTRLLRGVGLKAKFEII